MFFLSIYKEFFKYSCLSEGVMSLNSGENSNLAKIYFTRSDIIYCLMLFINFLFSLYGMQDTDYYRSKIKDMAGIITQI
jgi:hypothetical protein